MRFRFTLRDLFWLTLVVAIGIGWWLNNRRMAETIARLQQAPQPISLNDPRVERAMQLDTLDLPH